MMSMNANTSYGAAVGFSDNSGAGRRGQLLNPHDQLRTGIDSIFSNHSHSNVGSGLDHIQVQSSNQIRSQAQLTLQHSRTAF